MAEISEKWQFFKYGQKKLPYDFKSKSQLKNKNLIRETHTLYPDVFLKQMIPNPIIKLMEKNFICLYTQLSKINYFLYQYI